MRPPSALVAVGVLAGRARGRCSLGDASAPGGRRRAAVVVADGDRVLRRRWSAWSVRSPRWESVCEGARVLGAAASAGAGLVSAAIYEAAPSSVPGAAWLPSRPGSCSSSPRWSRAAPSSPQHRAPLVRPLLAVAVAVACAWGILGPGGGALFARHCGRVRGGGLVGVTTMAESVPRRSAWGSRSRVTGSFWVGPVRSPRS